ncbi:MAG: hypothetical protein ACKOC5_14315, partial [Chloroflexota bacterium]
ADAALAGWLALRGLRLGGRRIPQAAWLAGLFVLGLVDWLGVGRTLLSFRPAQAVLAQGQAAAERLLWDAARLPAGSSGELFRTYSPSYSLPQQTAAFYALQLADGVDPLQLSAYVDFMRQASGVPGVGYSVTLPPFAGGDPRHDNAAYSPDAAQLGLLNVAYVLAEFDLHAPGLELLDRVGTTRIYRNREARPRAWIQPADAALGAAYRRVERLDWSPDRISLKAAGPGLLVLSELDYPGWWARVDGGPRQAPLAPGELLRAVQLGPGEHIVEFGFSPASLWLGLAAALAGLAWLAWLAIGSRLGGWRAARQEAQL